MKPSYPSLNLLIMLFLALSISACGSRSSDFSSAPGVENPLPPCSETPNCVRTTRVYPDSIDAVWEAMLTALNRMKPYDVEITADEYRVDAIFLVVFFRDDVVIQLEESGDGKETFLHIRSSSRVGFTDFGVNRKRVEKLLVFLKVGKEF